jgi:hypothetical protein
MKASWLILQLTWRSALRILLLGALFGGIYSASFLVVVFFGEGGMRDGFFSVDSPTELLRFMFAVLIGGLIGALLGFAVGILVGLQISVITISWFLPLHDAPRYLQVVQLSSMLLGGIGTLIGILLLAQVVFGMTLNTEVGFLLVLSIIPALLASLAIWRGSAQVAAWYMRTADAHAALARGVGE